MSFVLSWMTVASFTGCLSRSTSTEAVPDATTAGDDESSLAYGISTDVASIGADGTSVINVSVRVAPEPDGLGLSNHVLRLYSTRTTGWDVISPPTASTDGFGVAGFKVSSMHSGTGQFTAVDLTRAENLADGAPFEFNSVPFEQVISFDNPAKFSFSTGDVQFDGTSAVSPARTAIDSAVTDFNAAAKTQGMHWDSSLSSGASTGVYGALGTDQRLKAMPDATNPVGMARWMDMTGILALYHFDETSIAVGGTAADTSGNGKDALLEAGANSSHVTPSGKIGGAVNLVGTSDRLKIPALGTSVMDHFTISMWVQASSTNTTTEKPLFEMRDSTVGSGSQIGLYVPASNDNDTRLRLAVLSYDSTTATSHRLNNTAVATGIWHHLVIQADGSSLSVWVDGLRLWKDSFTGRFNFAVPIYLNGSSLGTVGAGAMFDELAIWSRSLTEGEVSEINNRQAAAFTAGYESRVFFGGANATWLAMNPLTDRPTGKPMVNPLPSPTPLSETQYYDGNLAFQHCEMLLHFEGTDATALAVTDSSGNHLDMSASGGGSSALVDGGRFKKYLNLGRNFQYTSGDTGLASGAQQFTFMTWVKAVDPGVGVAFRRMVTADNADQFNISLDTNGYIILGLQHSSGAAGYLVSPNPITLGTWHHIAVTYDGTNAQLYEDGAALPGTLNYPAPLRSGAGALQLYNQGADYVGLDELAFYSVAWSAQDIRNSYARGAQRVRYQARSCSNANCSDGIYKGPNSSPTQFFSESTASVTSALAPIFSMVLPTNPYFQYWTDIESDAPMTSLAAPSMRQVAIGPSHLPTQPTPMVLLASIPFKSLSGFSATMAPSNAGAVKFQLGKGTTNDGNWYYFNGTSWVLATVAQGNTAAEMSQRVGSFSSTVGAGDVRIRIILDNGLGAASTAGIQEIRLTGTR